MRKFISYLSLCTLTALAISTNVQAARSLENDMPFHQAGPNFSGFYGNLGLSYNMLATSANYQADLVSLTEVPESVSGSGSQSVSPVGGLLKFGYAFRLQPKIYLGVAAFYNLHASQTVTNANVAYNAALGGGGTIAVSQKIDSSYGFLLQPGYILDSKSAVYLNLGMELTPVTVTSVVNANNGGGGALNSTSLSTGKTANTVKFGVGYQREMTFLKFKGSNNLTWFVEANYTPSSTLSITQAESVAPGDVPGRTETISAKVANTQLVVGINYYF
jgi:hypothetical protein